MRLSLLVAASALALAAAVEYKYEKDVLQLDADTFEAAVAEFDPLLVAFTAPWCGHCKTLKPEFAKAAKALKKEGMKIANVDATAHKELAERFEVTGFPTIKFFRGGVPSDYNGGRDSQAIVSWVSKKSGPVMTTITTAEDLEAFEEKGDAVVLCFAEADSEAGKACAAAAAKTDDLPFGITNSAELRAKYNLPATDAAVLSLNKFEGQDNIAPFTAPVEEWTKDSSLLAKWAGASSLPLVITFSQEAAPKIFRGEIKSHFLLFADAEDEGAGAQALGEFRTSAKAMSSSGAALFVNVPPSEDKVMGYFGITAAELPTAVLVNMNDGGMKKFKYTKPSLTSNEFSAFLTDYTEGKLKPFLKSDPAPDATLNAAADVKVMTGSNFEDLALDTGKDVLLEVYAPWCGHCKSLAPVYEKLGKAIKAAGLGDKITIAKMDGTSNEIDYPGVTVRGFPTLVFFPAGEKKAVEYDGGRDLDGFATFLAKNAKSASVSKETIEEAAEGIDEADEE